eukprot:TRINITY_DN8819_c0_g1_i3.p1 TRINITY_DN8819_c0_g1~~TRINITY_DN8819_c0_g1_i3.p1  ORF type:complete len:713 (+),score=255.52 TRINITY_DN8819_c0_g1_i3:125-2140(+)
MAEQSQTREMLEAAVAQQGAIVRELKKSKAPAEEIKAAVAELLARKQAVKDAIAQETGPVFDKAGFDDLMKRRFFYAPAFEIYGGVAGLYDYGPSGCAIKANLIDAWRKHFLMDSNMHEVACSALTPHYVLEASGHAERFADVMVKDVINGECHRADHLLEDKMAELIAAEGTTAAQAEEYAYVAQMAETYSKEELAELYKKYQIKSPQTGNDLTDPVDFNMMFGTQIGPTGQLAGFLRPETAQGIFLAFKRLYEFNNYRLPFGAAQIGSAFRNEISPAAGLLRVREFEMAEIEYFVDPEDKTHKRFNDVADIEVPLLSASGQQNQVPTKKMKLRDAVEQGVIANEALAYFVGRIYLFCKHIGVDEEKMRFRQHLPTEMAHYACDCWDCELFAADKWRECVGCADRSCYDLEKHAEASKQPIQASVTLAEPIIEDQVVIEPNKGVMGKALRNEAKVVFTHFEGMSNQQVEEFEAQLKDGAVTVNVDGKDYEIQPDWVKIKRKQVKIYERKFIPSVIEPSFGLGRLLYALLEHSFECREGDAQRVWLKLAAPIAPVKCSLLPLSNNTEFEPFLDEIASLLSRAGVSVRRDDSSASIGKRYARTDEIGIPFGITVDFDTAKDRTVTFRDRDSMQQVRIPIDELAVTASDLSSGKMSWEQVTAKYTVVGAAAAN